MPTLETLVIGQFVHDFVVFGYVERFEAAGAEHEMGDAVQGITVKQRLRKLAILMLDAMFLTTHVNIHTLLASLNTLGYKRHGSFVNNSHGLFFHDIGHGVSIGKDAFSFAMLVDISTRVFCFYSKYVPRL